MRGHSASEIRRRVGSRIAGSNATACFSQEGEDLVLARMFEARDHGFFVDVGAHDPYRFSNTYLLYLRGWRGINIDPRPGSAAAFRRARPRDISIEVAVSSVAGELLYHRFTDAALNTFDEERARWLEVQTDYSLVESLPVQVQTLDEVLAQHLPAGESITLLTIDVEGHEPEVFAGFDLSRYAPEVICVEDLSGGDLQHPAGVVATLLEEGYVMCASTKNSRFLARERRRWL